MKAVTIPKMSPLFMMNSVSKILYLKIENPNENGIAKTSMVGTINQ